MSTLWEQFNDDDSLMPIIVPLAFWVGTWVFCYHRGGKEQFANCNAIHDFHAIGVVLLASISLYFSDDDIFKERIMVCFAGTYFVVDLMDCVFRKDLMFLVHAVISLGLCIALLGNPVHSQHRTGSRGGMTEISSPQLHKWQKTKTKADFILFFLLFTGCRILWVPFFLAQLYGKIGWFPGISVSVLYYVLQLVWWRKLISMLLNYKEKKKDR